MGPPTLPQASRKPNTVTAQVTLVAIMPSSTGELEVFKADFTKGMAALLNLPSSFVHVTDVRSGSVVVDFEVAAPDEAAAQSALSDLMAVKKDTPIGKFKAAQA